MGNPYLSVVSYSGKFNRRVFFHSSSRAPRWWRVAWAGRAELGGDHFDGSQQRRSIVNTLSSKFRVCRVQLNQDAIAAEFLCNECGCPCPAKRWYNFFMVASNSQPKPCEQCGKTMMVPLSKWIRTRFCSRTCLGIENAARLNAIRPSPKTYAHKLRAANLGKRTGADNSFYVPPITMVCDNCGRSFDRVPHKAKRPTTNTYCSVKCRSAHRALMLKGENSPSWVGGPKTYRGRGWRAARLIVVDAQNECCADCGRHVGRSLPVHHIRPFRDFETVEAANDRSNLIGLCQPCHMKWEQRPPEQIAAPLD